MSETGNLLPHTRIKDSNGHGFVHLNDYDRLFHMIIEGGIKPFQGKEGFSSLIKITSDMTDEFKPFAVIWRADSLPIILHMAPTKTADNLFTVGVRIVPPNIAHATIELMVGPDTESKHNHYLLNEIALRTALSLCYESPEYDNETIRMLCCVGDELSYPTGIDLEAYPTRNERIEILGVMYDEYASLEDTSFDAQFFPQEFAQLDEFFEENFAETAPVITKVEPYLDTRAPISWGKSDYWVEMIRCDKCGQRVILGLTKAQCPEGQPDVSFACKACKTTIKHL